MMREVADLSMSEMLAFVSEFMPRSVAERLHAFNPAVQKFVCQRLMQAMSFFEERRIDLDPVAFEAVMEVISTHALMNAIHIIDLSSGDDLV